MAKSFSAYNHKSNNTVSTRNEPYQKRSSNADRTESRPVVEPTEDQSRLLNLLYDQIKRFYQYVLPGIMDENMTDSKEIRFLSNSLFRFPDGSPIMDNPYNQPINGKQAYPCYLSSDETSYKHPLYVLDRSVRFDSDKVLQRASVSLVAWDWENNRPYLYVSAFINKQWGGSVSVTPFDDHGPDYKNVVRCNFKESDLK